jgi:formylmethanofuran dehydrogenase subunit A
MKSAFSTALMSAAVELDRLSKPDDMSTVINAMKRGEYFVTSGEVVIASYAVEGAGTQRTVTADVEWTFPLEFVEVVWKEVGAVRRVGLGR